MSGLFITVASIIALVLGYQGIEWTWLFLVALGYFFPVALSRYNQTMSLLDGGKVGLVTISFVWIYLASVAGVAFNYFVGLGVGWLVASVF